MYLTENDASCMLTCSDRHTTTRHHGTVFGQCWSHRLQCGFPSSYIEIFMFILFSPFVIVLHDKGHLFSIVKMLHCD
jgi:hypothetical protein